MRKIWGRLSSINVQKVVICANERQRDLNDRERASRMEGQMPDKVKQQRRNAAMAAQHEVAVSISESFVGRTINVLVEKQATAQEIKGARISSWEHGLLRGTDAHLDGLRGADCRPDKNQAGGQQSTTDHPQRHFDFCNSSTSRLNWPTSRNCR